MIEVANIADEAAVGATFAKLAKSEGQPPLSQRIDPSERPALAALLKRNGFHDGDFAATDTWAAALMIVRQDKEGSDPRYGVDRAVIAQAEGRSEEHTSELQSLMRTSYAVFCLKKKIRSFHPTIP